MLTTTFDNKALILGQLWINYKDEDEFSDFFDYNDLGLPLAFAFAEGIINHTPSLEQYVNETWDLLIEGMELEDIGFEDIQEMFDKQNEQRDPKGHVPYFYQIVKPKTFKTYYDPNQKIPKPQTLRTLKTFPQQNLYHGYKGLSNHVIMIL